MHLRSTKPSLSRYLAAALSLLFLATPAWAAVADLSSTPLATQSTAAIRPNLMFILDDSGSMGDDFLPDDANYSRLGKYGRNASQCNGLAYNPAATYDLPVDASGQPLPAGTYNRFLLGGIGDPAAFDTVRDIDSAAPNVATGSITVTVDAGNNNNNAYASGNVVTLFSNSDPSRAMTGTVTAWNSTTRRLTVNITTVYGSGTLNQPRIGNGSVEDTAPSYYTYSGSQPAMSYRYTTTGVDTGSTFYRECNSNVGSNPGRGVFTKVTLTSATMTQHYRNWYTYYRTRMLTMKSALSKVFSNIDATRFRVGFSTIHDQGSTDGSEFLNIRDFDSGTQKSDFYTKLFATTTGGYTPLRSALSKAGRYYAKKLSGQTYDPIQYSCQRNYTILSSDGYWNTNDEWTNSIVTLSGGAIGNQDGPNASRPYLDDWRSGNRTGGTGKENTLADIAMYYYKTDLRDGDNCGGSIPNQDVCYNNVDKVEGDEVQHQHMNTFTVGLGLAGTLVYDPQYPKQQSGGDYFDIVNGNRPWPNPIDNTGAERVDDMWHAAVNGRGYFYSARNSAELVSSLTDALDGITAETGSGAAAATSTLTPLQGDNYLYLASYRTVVWTGDVKAMTINPSSGAITSTPPVWSAASQLLSKVGANSDSRTILFRRGTTLREFTYNELTAAGLNGAFDDMCPSGAPKLSQCTTITDAAVKAQLSGANLVNWLRGHGQYENVATNTTRLFRDRVDLGQRNVLGDIVRSAPIYIKRPTLKYADTGYADFAAAKSGRQGVVYVGSNDGMLHALNADNGAELWAFVPTAVMSKMHKLADLNYSNNHVFLVDGALSGGDVYDPNATNADGSRGGWRTIIVGGLNTGGRSYYALDVTVPTSPVILWEFSDADLGFTFGNPVITKLKNGNWVVAFSSGYNNVSTGTGQGYLYVLNAITGEPLEKIGTGAGSTATPSNLGRINAWVDSEFDNTALRFYGTDMLGNVWRFDHDDNIAPGGKEALLLAQTRAANGAVQPITTRPELGEIRDNGNRHALVAVGTGRYLGLSDVGTTGTQSIYVFKDTLSSTGYGNLRDNGGMVAQTLAEGTVDNVAGIVVSNHNDVNWTTATGWYTDLNVAGHAGERVNVDMQLQLDVLTVAGNVPGNNACESGGRSYLYSFNFKSGNAVEGDGGLLGVGLGNQLVVGQTVIGLGAGSASNPAVGTTCVLVVKSDGTVECVTTPKPPGTTSLRRTSWRELAN